MKKWFCTLMTLVMLSGVAHARHHHEDDDDAPPPPAPASAPASQQTPAAGSGVPNGAQIYVWKERGVVHAVSSPSDVPPRYSKRAQSPEADPRIVRMEPEGAPPGTVKPAAVKGKVKKSGTARKHAPVRRKRPAPSGEGR